CVFLDESGLHINMKRSIAWSKKGSKTGMKITIILSATSALSIIECSLRKEIVQTEYFRTEVDTKPREMGVFICSVAQEILYFPKGPSHKIVVSTGKKISLTNRKH
ncbi:hypothetical protein BX666DRAFT_1853426, partial [Dichotomocladium elegans]